MLCLLELSSDYPWALLNLIVWILSSGCLIIVEIWIVISFCLLQSLLNLLHMDHSASESWYMLLYAEIKAEVQ